MNQEILSRDWSAEFRGVFVALVGGEDGLLGGEGSAEEFGGLGEGGGGIGQVGHPELGPFEDNVAGVGESAEDFEGAGDVGVALSEGFELDKVAGGVEGGVGEVDEGDAGSEAREGDGGAFEGDAGVGDVPADADGGVADGVHEEPQVVAGGEVAAVFDEEGDAAFLRERNDGDQRLGNAGEGGALVVPLLDFAGEHADIRTAQRGGEFQVFGEDALLFRDLLFVLGIQGHRGAEADEFHLFLGAEGGDLTGVSGELGGQGEVEFPLQAAEFHAVKAEGGGLFEDGGQVPGGADERAESDVHALQALRGRRLSGAARRLTRRNTANVAELYRRKAR